jgi:hypothetical protein
MQKIVFIAAAVIAANAQTQIDLRTQAKSIDFTAANSTKPFKAGTALPGTCAVGEMFFNTGAAVGANLYACTAANTWSVQGGLSSNSCWINTSDNVLNCQDTSGNVYSAVKTAVAGTANQWVTYIDATGIPHTSQPTAGAVGAVADPGANGIPYRNGTGTAAPATADNLSGPFFCQDAGYSGAYACNLTPPIATYQIGTTYWFKANTTNTGAATINFNSLVPKRIVKQVNQDLAAGDVKTGQWVVVTYDGANMQMQSQTSNAPAGGVSTVFGRSGAITALSGDYTTAQVSESGNLYFTTARTWAALSAGGPITFSGSTGTFNCPTCITSATAADTDLYGSFPHLNVVRLQGRPVTTTPPTDLQYLGWNAFLGQWEPKTVPAGAVTSIFGRSGAILAGSGDYSTAQVTESGNLYFTNARVWAALSAGGPITFSGSGAFNCPTCITSATVADTDLSGNVPHLTVAAIQGRRLATSPPVDLQYLGWNASANQWEPKTLPAAPVTSIFGRTGIITQQSGDYSFTQITGTASASQLPAVAMRTDQSNAVATGTTQDFSKALHTLPMQSGVTANLPGLCTIGETYFATDAPASANVYGCTAANTWTDQGTLTVQSNGLAVGTRQKLNFVTGTGLVNVITDDGTELNVQTALDTSVAQTQIGDQSGATLFCGSTGGLTSNYVCSLSPTLTTYTMGMLLRWLPDVNGAGGPTTLNVDTLGNVPIKLLDGVTNPTSANIVGGQLYEIWYDGASFRLPPTVAAGGLADPGVNGVLYRSALGTAQPATADNLSGPFFCQDSGSSSAYACTLSPAIQAYGIGTSYWFKANSTNTGPATINFNSLGAKAVKKLATQALAAGDIQSGQWVMLTYDGTNMQMQTQAATAAGGVTSVFSRSGVVTAQTGDYTTAQVTESGNLYFTNSRAQSAMSGLYQSPISGAPSTWPSFGSAALQSTSYFQTAISGAPSTWPSTWAWASLTGVPSTFAPINTGNWAGTWQTYSPSYFQTAISGAPSTWPSLGGAALLNVGTTTGTVAAGNDTRIVGAASLTGSNTFTGYSNFSGASLRMPESTFASLPPSPLTGQVVIFTDALVLGTCSGGGTSLAICRYTGSGWAAIAGGGSGGMTWPTASGIAVYGGSSAWGTSLTVGIAASNLVQLNGSSQLPAVDGSQLTGIPKTTTPGTTGTAPGWSSGVLEIPMASSSPVTAGLLSNTDWSTFNGKAASNAATTVNGQTCTLGSSCNANSGATAHSVALNEGSGSAIGGVGPGTTNQLLAAVSSGDPNYKSLADLNPTEYAAGGGTAQAQTVTLAPAATALSTGLRVRWLPLNANTAAAPTLAVNGLAAKPITKCGAAALVAGDLTTTAVADATYDGTEFQLLNPQAVPCGVVVDAPSWQICNPAGCGSETSNGYYAIMNPNGVTFDECGVNLAIAATGSSVIVDVQDSNGNSIFGATKLVVPINTTTEVFQSTFSSSPYAAVKGAKFRAAVTQNDSGGTAQFAYVRCRVH